MKAKLFDITKWVEKPHKQTEGTRDKRVLISPDDGAVYYFKTSIKKMKKDYKMEFWSEVIASRIGRWLGFDTAEYNVAVLDEPNGLLVGCLSQSIYDPQEETMHSGYNILVAYDAAFKQYYKEEGYHNLKRIYEALEHQGLEHLFYDMLECWLFDLIIGNGDRHSENWAVIFSKSIPTLLGILAQLLELKSTIDQEDLQERRYSLLEQLRSLTHLGHIYDSGSSLGREIKEHKIPQMLRDKRMFTAYLDRAKGDISVRQGASRKSWENFELLKEDYGTLINERITFLREKAVGNKEELRNIINEIDADVREHIPECYRLSTERKELIFRLVYERIKRMID